MQASPIKSYETNTHILQIQELADENILDGLLVSLWNNICSRLCSAVVAPLTTTQLFSLSPLILKP